MVVGMKHRVPENLWDDNDRLTTFKKIEMFFRFVIRFPDCSFSKSMSESGTILATKMTIKTVAPHFLASLQRRTPD